MRKKTDISEDELNLFRQAVKDSKPIKQNKIRLTPHAPKKSRHKISGQETHPSLEDPLHIPAVQSEEYLSYQHPSISNKRLRKLRKGQYNVDAVLDLHGMTADEAKNAVEKFLQHALGLGQRVVLIIHGKGRRVGPVLKTKINYWLRQLPVVLAFCSADSSHGSRGAIYVLLKRTLQENVFE